MRSATTRLSLAGLSLLVCIAAWGQSPHFDPAKMMRAEEVRRGMKGVGKSVFSGVEIEEFDLEILGVLSKANLGGDLVLARVTSGPVVARGMTCAARQTCQRGRSPRRARNRRSAAAAPISSYSRVSLSPRSSRSNQS